MESNNLQYLTLIRSDPTKFASLYVSVELPRKIFYRPSVSNILRYLLQFRCHFHKFIQRYLVILQRESKFIHIVFPFGILIQAWMTWWLLHCLPFSSASIRLVWHFYCSCTVIEAKPGKHSHRSSKMQIISRLRLFSLFPMSLNFYKLETLNHDCLTLGHLFFSLTFCSFGIFMFAYSALGS